MKPGPFNYPCEHTNTMAWTGPEVQDTATLLPPLNWTLGMWSTLVKLLFIYPSGGEHSTRLLLYLVSSKGLPK